MATKFIKHDDYQTPRSAWEAIRPYIPTDKTIWEPFYCDGKSGEIMRDMGYNVIHRKEDFFENNHGDIVVSNPPYSMKRQVLERLIRLDKPFILLMPLATLACRYMRALVGDSIQLIIPPKRIEFIKMADGIPVKVATHCSFDTIYFCWKMSLQKDIIYLEWGAPRLLNNHIR